MSNWQHSKALYDRQRGGDGVDVKGRSKRSQSRRNKRNRFVMFEHWFLNTQAYKSLSGSAAKLLIEFYKRYNGTNNGAICLGYRDAAEATGLSRGAVGRALVELKDRGFVMLTKKGHFDHKRQAATWALTEHLERDAVNHKAFVRWKPGLKQSMNEKTIGPVSMPHRPRNRARPRLSDIKNRRYRPRIEACS